MSPTPAQAAAQTSHTARLHTRITRMNTMLKRAREDGDPLYVDMAERDLNNLLDQLPRHSTAQEDTCSTS